MKLKTLKDFKATEVSHFGDCISRILLKQEAIKWVKKFYPIHKKGYLFTLGDFMDFFNLTEEDLR